MNILIVSQHFYPEEFRINEIATELVKRGHNVDVVTGLPNYPKGEIFPGYKEKLYEVYNGVKIFRAKIRPRHQGSVNLFLNYMSFMLKAKKKVRDLDNDYDIIFSYQTSPVFQIVPAIYAKKINKCKLICMCCDQWPESLKARGIKSGLIYNYIGRKCRKIYNKCDYIINTSPSFIDYNHTVNKVPLEKMDWFLQHCEDYFTNELPVKDENEYVDLMFAGNIGKVQNVEDIINAYDMLKIPNLRIHILGSGSSFEICKNMISKKKLDNNIILYGRVQSNEMANYYKRCDACILTLSGKNMIGNTIPSKLQGYMSAGKVVLAAINGDSRKVIDDSKCGIYTDPDDVNKLAKLFLEYYNNKERYNKQGINGRVYFEKYSTIESFIVYLLKIFDEFKK